MRCPFLNEAQVRSCERAGIRTMIRAEGADGRGRCSSSGYADCRIYVENPRRAATGGFRCPYAAESGVQYCAAAPARQFIPCSGSPNVRCETGSHRYCDLYLEKTGSAGIAQDPLVDGVLVPRRLFYSSNHMWLDLFDDGWCAVGLDAFFARVVGRVDRVVPIGITGARCPTAVVWAHGMEFEMVFPNPIHVTGYNNRVRVEPARILADPCGAGWLLEGRELGAGARYRSATSGLIFGAEALEWMRSEMERLTRLLGGHEDLSALERLDSSERCQLVHEFFSMAAHRTR
ncbi:MAG: hypothetical protein ABSG25_04775 [Bryobacteraceae bacterium]